MDNIFKDYEIENIEKPNEQGHVTFAFSNAIEYLQKELKLFKIRAMEWEIERTQLKAHICYLLGERKGNANIRNDLLARIRVLEFALSRSNNADTPQAEIPISVDFNYEHDAEGDIPQYDNYSGNWAHGRETLRRYLNEFEFGDRLMHLSSPHSTGDSRNASISTNILSKTDDNDFAESNQFEKNPYDDLLEICDEFESQLSSKDDEISESEKTLVDLKNPPSLLSSVLIEDDHLIDDQQMDLLEDDFSRSMELEGDQFDDYDNSPLRLVSLFNIDDSVTNLINRNNLTGLIEMGETVELNMSVLGQLNRANELFRNLLNETALKIVLVSEISFVGLSERGVLFLWSNYVEEPESYLDIVVEKQDIMDITVCQNLLVVLTGGYLLTYSVPQLEVKDEIVLSVDDFDEFLYLFDVYSDQNMIFLCSRFGSFVLVNPFNADSLQKSTFPGSTDLGEITSFDVDFTMDLVAIGYNSCAVRLFTLNDGEAIFRRDLSLDMGQFMSGGIKSLAFSSVNTLLSLSNEGNLCLWDLGCSDPLIGEMLALEAIFACHIKTMDVTTDYFAVICKGGKIVIYESGVVGTLPCDN